MGGGGGKKPYLLVKGSTNLQLIADFLDRLSINEYGHVHPSPLPGDALELLVTNFDS